MRLPCRALLVVLALVVVGACAPSSAAPSGADSAARAGESTARRDPSAKKEPAAEPTEPDEVAAAAEVPAAEPIAPVEPSASAPAPAPAPEAPARPAGVPAEAQAGVVERITDGDTINVRIDVPGGALTHDATHTIRLLQIDTPETVAPGQPVECGGPEATEFAVEQLPVRSTVWLEADEDDTDQYGRYLRYVYAEDGSMFNETALAAGVAEHLIYQPNERYSADLAAAAAAARSTGVGLYGAPCDIDAPPPPPPPVVVPAVPEPDPEPASAPVEEDAGGCDENYTPCVPIASDVDCAGGSGNGPAYVEGPVQIIGSDPYGLDADADGVGCQS